MTFPAGLAPSQLRTLSNIGHCKWIPASAGMKCPGGDADATGVTVSQVIRFLSISIKTEFLDAKITNVNIRAICAIRDFGLILCSFLYNESAISASSAATVFVFLFGFLFSFDIRYSTFDCSIFSSIFFSVFSVSLCFSLLSLVFSLKPNAESRTPERSLTMEKPNTFQHTVSKVFSINPGTAGLFRTVRFTYFVSTVHRERTRIYTLYRSHSRSGRRGRMRRHTRDYMASRGRDTGKSRPKGRHSLLFGIVGDNALCSLSMFKERARNLMPMFRLPLSSPGVCGTNPPAKPTGKFYRPNRQWCGARRGGGEGSPRARVSLEQFKQPCCNPSAIFVYVAERQQRERSSGHRRAAGSMARTRASRIMDVLEMKKRYDFHIREDQQNMGTGNAAVSRCLYPFLRPREFFNRPVTPLCKTVRAGVAY